MKVATSHKKVMVCTSGVQSEYWWAVGWVSTSSVKPSQWINWTYSTRKWTC